MSEIILTYHKPPQNVFKFRVETNNNCFHICGKIIITFKVPLWLKVITFKGPYYICGKMFITYKGPYLLITTTSRNLL